MSRVYTKIGDIFEAQIDGKNKKFFQLIAYDLYQLNSDVIRAFTRKYTIGETPSVEEIIQGDVQFYAHCITKFGVKFQVWKKIGSSRDVGDLNNIWFRDTNAYGIRHGEKIPLSENWSVWRLGDLNSTYVGKLKEEQKKAELGLVFNPYSILERIKTGSYKYYMNE